MYNFCWLCLLVIEFIPNNYKKNWERGGKLTSLPNNFNGGISFTCCTKRF